MFALRSNILLICAMFPTLLFAGHPQERTIKAGDAIEIIVPENEELTKTVLVNPNGMMNYPTLEDLRIDGITLQQFKEILVAQLSRFLERTPLILVRFSDSYPIKVTVLGQVVNPGVHVIPNIATLQGAIGAAGGFIAGAQVAKIRHIKKVGDLQTNRIIDMEAFYLNGDLSILPTMDEGDIVVVPGYPSVANVKVLGAVENPGSFEVFFRASVLDAIYMAGGPSNVANMKKIKIVSMAGQTKHEIRIDLKELIESDTFRNLPIVVPGDIVYVPEKTLTWGKIAGVMRDILPLATLYVLIQYGRTR